MPKRTPLFEYSRANAKLAEFAGFEMPLWYTSTTDEHLAVRNAAGIFDVSHMGRVVVSGKEAGKFVDQLVPTSSSLQPTGKSFYTLLLNEQAGIIDDLIIIKRGEDDYLLVINAANTEKDLTHIRNHSNGFDIQIEDITPLTTMIAIQGPDAFRALQPLTPIDLNEVKRFRNVESVIGGAKAAITRTGYTGEDGFEIILYGPGIVNNDDNNVYALRVWIELTKRAKPCGLGARDSLRIEAGLPLYGSDIDESTNPVEAELSWVISREKQGYIGSQKLGEILTRTPERLRRGIVLHDKIPRHGFEVTNGDGGKNIGKVTSGTFSPIIRRGVALGYVQREYSRVGQSVKVVVRGDHIDADIVKPPFYDETLYGWKRSERAKR